MTQILKKKKKIAIRIKLFISLLCKYFKPFKTIVQTEPIYIRSTGSRDACF